MDINHFLVKAADLNASDVFITANAPISVKVNGEIIPMSTNRLTPEQSRKLVLSLMDDKTQEEFSTEMEANFAFVLNKDVRFRVNAYVQRDQIGCIMRKIQTRIPTLEQLELPPMLKNLVMSKRGLIFFVGATGTGKSTSLAAMVGHRNRNSKGHIITIEDPIEFMHEHDKSLVMQREVGSDTHSFDNALKNTLRQAPDVILVGEIRTAEAMNHALTFAETGHLVLATLHANNANQAIERILHFFPTEKHKQVMLDLSLNLHAIIAQRLVAKPKSGRKAILEILLGTPRVNDLIKRGDIHELKDTMKKSETQGMISFDRALIAAVRNGEITIEAALENADSINEVRLALKLRKPHNSAAETKTLSREKIDARSQQSNSTSSERLGSLSSIELETTNTEENHIIDSLNKLS
ncbi:MAG: PilT/PilU family type 4a pilus ATPase [Gammaproteobacteria bacterium]|nr:PilT/PilU family type 4a pilus ATPase [Gammaproteobacteria bacterium]